jgi:hypothetical protein
MSNERGDTNLNLIDQVNPDAGVVLTYESNTRCREGKNYNIDIKVNCNQDVFRTKY